jgi:hypothetical protein
VDSTPLLPGEHTDIRIDVAELLQNRTNGWLPPTATSVGAGLQS